MNAWLLDSLGGLDALRLADDVPDPTPGVGEVVLAVNVAGLNPADRYLSEGQYPAKPVFPHILGRDGVGRISAVGSGVTGFQVGDRALVLRGETGVSRAGTFAGRVAVAVDSLTTIPAGWTEQEAAGAPLVYLTAYQALTQFAGFVPNVVLITGASGGVGVATLHLAKAAGQTVVALSRSIEKGKKLKEIGADIVLDPQDARWPDALKPLLNSRKVDLVVDNIGGEIFNQSVATLGMHGRVSVVGRLAGPVPQFNTASLFFRRIQIGGVHVGAFSRPEAQAAWKSIVGTLSQAGVKPLVDSVHPFGRLKEAFARLAEGPMGKVLLQVAD